jgi:hypothetical protein
VHANQASVFISKEEVCRELSKLRMVLGVEEDLYMTECKGKGGEEGLWIMICEVPRSR